MPCPRCRTPLEPEDLRCPICKQAAPAHIERDRPETMVEVLRCDGCGAAVSYSVEAGAPQCAFCGSVMHLERSVDPREQIESFVPFAVSHSEAKEAFKRWLSTLGFFRPSDLVSGATLESLQSIWWVGWSVDADALVSWTADSDFGKNRAKWAPHAGQAEMSFRRLLVPATRGLTRKETSFLAGTYRLDSAKPHPGLGGENTVIEQFEMVRSQARERVAAQIERMVRARVTGSCIPGTRFRKVHSSVLLRGLRTMRVAFPAHIIAYRYRGHLYRTVLSGQDDAAVMGSAPYSLFKIVGAIAVSFLGLLLTLTVLSLLLS